MTHSDQPAASQPPASGIALPTVMVMLMLSSLLALAAWRSIWLNELLLQSRADAIRTQWLADATLLAGLDDVLQRTPLTAASATTPVSSRHEMGNSDQSHVFFPKNVEALTVLRQRLGANVCQEGICAPMQPLPSNSTYWQGMTSSAMLTSSENNISQTTNALPNKYYWVEIFLQTNAQGAQTFVYRITALTTGLKSSKSVVVQAIWVPHVSTESTINLTHQGRWLSWTVLHD